MCAAAAAIAAEPVADFSERLAAFLSERSAEPIARIELPPHEALAALAATPGVHAEFALVSGRSEPGANAVAVSFSRGDEPIRRAVVNARVWVQRDVVIAAHALRAGDVLSAADVASERREVATPRGDALDAPSAALGQRISRPVAAGELLRLAWLTTAPSVKRGDRVTLRLERGALTIETLGRAEEDGALGAWIRVRNLGSSSVLIGRVSAEGVIRVEI